MMYDFSVIIPTYNRINYLKQAIASCFDGNDEIAIEVIVVDDGSTDGTQEYLKENYLQFSQTGKSHIVNPIFQSHQGVQVARNQGLQLANGEFIKFLDDDDWLASRVLTLELKELRKFNADVCYGSYEAINTKGETISKFPQDYPNDLIAAILSRSITTCIFKFSYRHSFIYNLSWSTTTLAQHDLHFILLVAFHEPNHIPSKVFVGYYRQHSDGYRESVNVGKAKKSALARLEVTETFLKELNNQNKLTNERLLAAADGLWMSAHLTASSDLKIFDIIFNKIQTLAPNFLPKRPFYFLSILDRLINPRRVEYILYPLRYIKKQIKTKK